MNQHTMRKHCMGDIVVICGRMSLWRLKELRKVAIGFQTFDRWDSDAARKRAARRAKVGATCGR